MSQRIHILAPQVAELIAAGEVVERPASIVKELLENAVDAGAQKITVEIKNGGISYIRVTDDGSGIEKEDLPTAFVRHATSKVTTAEDLDGIASFGFRGEALASIAAVSRVEVLSRTSETISGGRYVIHGGEEVDFSDAGCPAGTTIVVRDVFYNTPARMKFLKKDSTEAGTIANIVDKIALGNPHISFRFIRDGQVKLSTPGDGDLLSVIYSVYGREFAQQMLPVQYTHEFVTVEGYICKPTASRSTRSMQNFFINSRYVRSRTCMAALEEAYKSSLMTGKFPSCVLNVKIPPNTVDVNVHPAKVEVRFSNERPIFDAVYRGCKEALNAAGEVSFLPKEESAAKSASVQFVAKDFDYSGRQQRMSAEAYRKLAIGGDGRGDELPLEAPSFTVVTGKDGTRLHFSIPSVRPEQSKHSVREPAAPVSPEEDLPFGGISAVPKHPTSISASDFSTPKQVSRCEFSPPAPEPEMALSSSAVADEGDRQEDYKILGELFGTFILVEYRDTFVMVDKHAAHERILYNRLKRETELNERQVLLAPVPVSLSRQEYDAALSNLAEFEKIGFLIEDFGGGSVLVREIPTMLPLEEVTGAVQEAAGKLLEGKRQMMPEAVDDLLHSVACKAAIKAHDRTSMPEMADLVRVIRQDRDVRFCPHGRPVSITMTKSEIERRFGRLV